MRVRRVRGVAGRVPCAAGSRPPAGRPVAQRLESRTLLATFVVTDPGDAEPGTLRQAILGANASAEADTITFELGAGPVQTIRPLSALPEVTGRTTTIDGWTQPYGVVKLDGSLAGAGVSGLTVSGALSSNRFSSHGVVVHTGAGIRLEANYIGAR